jgi:hypothetical protein
MAARAYFRLKPWLPRRFRTFVRRRQVKALRRRCTDTWPIDEAAGGIPQGWQGWPDGHEFALVFTHDVESRAGVAKVRQLAALLADARLRSSFNFIPEGSYPDPVELRNWLTANGFEVGVHDLHHDGLLYRSRRGFRANALRINHYLDQWGAVGFRSGFMLRRLDWLHDLAIIYDASTFDTDPFEPQPEGSRTIFPFEVRAGEDPAARGYVELPYTLPQDSTLYLLLDERTPAIWRDKLDWIARHGGLALVNIHPDYIDFTKGRHSRFRYPASLVAEFIDHAVTRYAGRFWNPLPRELADWYLRQAGT